MLVNHYKFKLHEQPEQYFYALLLLFKPWRNTTELKADFNTYTEAFLHMQSSLPDASEYHRKITNQELHLDEMKKLIEEENIKADVENDEVIDEVLGYVPKEVKEAMNDFQGITEALQNEMKECDA